VNVKSKASVIGDSSLNHAVQLSPDNSFIYASNIDQAFRWSYDASSTKNTSAPDTIVTDMTNGDHSTRTLLLSAKMPGMMLVSRGSGDNIDPIAADIKSGRSQLRVFNVSAGTEGDWPYQYNTTGTLMGWGLRNSVGVAEHPVTGGIYTVENSADDVERMGVDIHTDNPGEEMNFHSTVEAYFNGTKDPRLGASFGYPTCFAAWNVSHIPQAGNLQVGMEFAINDVTVQGNTDADCQKNSVQPRLTFPAHWAPLDVLFNKAGNLAWVTSHGSWDRDPPDGYLLFAVPFSGSSGSPIASANSTTSWTPIMTNKDNHNCPNSCFRPVGLAFDSKGRLFMSSDSTGEIYVITASDGGSVDAMNVVGNFTGGSPAPPKKGSATKGDVRNTGLLVAIAAVVLALMIV